MIVTQAPGCAGHSLRHIAFRAVCDCCAGSRESTFCTVAHSLSVEIERVDQVEKAPMLCSPAQAAEMYWSHWELQPGLSSYSGPVPGHSGPGPVTQLPKYPLTLAPPLTPSRVLISLLPAKIKLDDEIRRAQQSVGGACR